jgi:RimJ/RimL family protein N-acetyltransferase
MLNSFLIGDIVNLRPLELEDAHFLYLGENNPIVREALFMALPIPFIVEEEKIKRYMNSNDSIMLTIIEKTKNVPVGQTGLTRIDYIHRTAIYYLAIVEPAYWSRGLGAETTHLMIKYAFETLNLNRVQLHVCSENAPAIKIYKRVGFVKEGVLRQAMYRNGGYHDFWVMGILKKDWLAQKGGVQEK